MEGTPNGAEEAEDLEDFRMPRGCVWSRASRCESWWEMWWGWWFCSKLGEKVVGEVGEKRVELEEEAEVALRVGEG